MSTPLALGIDFGNSFTTACWWNPKSNMPEIIRNEHGDERTPSIVFRGLDGVLVGKPAEQLLTESIFLPPEDQAAVLGRTFARFKSLLKNNLPQALPDGSQVTCIELVADLLIHIKRMAEQLCFHETIPAVVLTHPAAFTPKEKENLTQAATLAGFKEVALVEEPVAAILGYMASGAKAGDGVLVYNLGAGSCDVTYVKREGENQFRLPLRTCGVAIGGDDFDRAIYDHFDQLLISGYGVGFGGASKRLNLAMLMKCRRCKEKLSTLSQVRIAFYLPEKRQQAVLQMIRPDFEKLILEKVQRVLDLTRTMLNRIQEAEHDLNTVLLVGGATRTPLVRQALEAIMPVPPLNTMHADEAAAMGTVAYQMVKVKQPKAKSSTSSAPSITSATKEKPWENSLGMRFVPIPGLNCFFSIWLTRVQDYAAYISATTHKWPNPDFHQAPNEPVVMVSWEDAKTYCDWLTVNESKKDIIMRGWHYCLPTDAEWSKAVGVGTEIGSTPKNKDGKIKDIYPWGVEWPPPPNAGNYAHSLGVDTYYFTSPVGSFPGNCYNLYDMGGNVWEWCEDLYDPQGTSRVTRGASWSNSEIRLLLSSARNHARQRDCYNNLGFRCILRYETCARQ